MDNSFSVNAGVKEDSNNANRFPSLILVDGTIKWISWMMIDGLVHYLVIFLFLGSRKS